ncbi:hypothetical protein CIPAW_03G034500 [Carya illinoinensis]|uniref:Uncharacterized protein n=1 Tax=Carya illinoinensis TaxID=32201 RepID=A0A8T1QZ78_CARIL|nr:hypothetical protein CIPAW_03G034500 [Carya illinoinensis]
MRHFVWSGNSFPLLQLFSFRFQSFFPLSRSKLLSVLKVAAPSITPYAHSPFSVPSMRKPPPSLFCLCEVSATSPSPPYETPHPHSPFSAKRPPPKKILFLSVNHGLHATIVVVQISHHSDGTDTIVDSVIADAAELTVSIASCRIKSPVPHDDGVEAQPLNLQTQPLPHIVVLHDVDLVRDLRLS